MNVFLRAEEDSVRCLVLEDNRNIWFGTREDVKALVQEGWWRQAVDPGSRSGSVWRGRARCPKSGFQLVEVLEVVFFFKLISCDDLHYKFYELSLLEKLLTPIHIFVHITINYIYHNRHRGLISEI